MKYLIEDLPQGIKFKIRKNTKKVTDLDMIDDVWKRKDYHLRGFTIKKNDIVIDIGAHIGTFTVYAAMKAKGGTVFSFEPEKENFKLLKQNIILNNLKNIKAFNLGVCGIKGKTKLYLNNSNDAGHSIYQKTGKYEIVNCTTLRGIFDANKIEKCDFLKIDCEGAEFEILFKAPREYLKKIDKIILEYHEWLYTKKTHKDLQNFLKSSGFDVKARKVEEKKGFLYARRY